jgi:hypothetical protein
MTFSLIHTWATGEELTHAQMNAVAVYLTNALDKSAAGDTLSGVINMASTAQIQAEFTGNIFSVSNHGIQSDAFGGIESLVSGGITTLVSGGISAGVAHGITDGGFAGGIAATVAGGIQSTVTGGITAGVISGIRPGVAGGINVNLTGGMIVSATAGLETNTPGGIALSGGTSDWITYSQPRSVSVAETCGSMVISTLPSNWSTGGTDVPNSAVSGNPLYLSPHKLLNGSANGATLASITIAMSVGASHSGAPATPPTVNLVRTSFAPGGVPGSTIMFSTGVQSFWPPTALGGIATPSGSSWYSSGNVQQITFTPDTATVIDTTQYGYYLAIVDEQGANALAGNVYHAVIFNFDDIAGNGL